MFSQIYSPSSSWENNDKELDTRKGKVPQIKYLHKLPKKTGLARPHRITMNMFFLYLEQLWDCMNFENQSIIT